MEKDKFQSMEKRAASFKAAGIMCDCCEKKPAVIQYRGLYLCGDCLNPDYEAVHQKHTRHYWCGLKSSWGDF
jgi:uncharacterized CHY-type Zn-finger protein